MAECSYARCLQERRLIKNELKRWSKDMLLAVGLERVAEELMGGRKWKHLQETLSRAHLNTDHLTASIEQFSAEALKHNNSGQDHTKLDVNRFENSVKTEKQLDGEQQIYQEDHRQPGEKDKERNLEYRPESRDGITLKEKQKLQKETAEEPEVEANNSTNTTTITSHNQDNQEHNNNISSTASKSSLKVANNITVPATPTSLLPPTPPEPIDWKPNEKCYFCVDGKLLTVNSKGELVAESGPAMSEADHAHKLDTDSDSNESTPIAGGGRAGSLTDNNRFNFHELLTSRLRDLPANMTSIDPIAPHLAALQSINWLQLAQRQQQLPGNSVTPTTSDTSAAAISPSRKDSPSPSDATGEQPLDLSSKPSPNSSISGDLKNVRTKSSRSTPVPPTARRTYSEDDLHNAVQDIVNGKLGTRKAAVQYNVPRSTLRNKVCKLTMEAKRNNGQTPIELLHLQHELEMDKDMSGDEEDDSSASTPQPDAHQSALDDLASATLRKLCENNGASLSAAAAKAANASPKPGTPQAEVKRQSGTPVGVPQSQASPQPQLPFMLDPNVLRNLNVLFGGSGAQQPNLDETVTVRDLLILLHPAIKDIFAAAAAAVAAAPTASADSNSALNNGKPNMLDHRLLLQQLQQQQVSPYSQRLPNSGTPETTSSLDPNEAYDDLSTILKIPSFKPGAGTSSAAARTSGSPSLHGNSGGGHNHNNITSNCNRNGESPHSAPSPRIDSSILAAAVAAASGNSVSSRQGNSISVISPPLLHHHRGLSGAESQSPPTRSFGDTIVDSIHRTMNEQSNNEAHAASMLGLGSDVDRNDYKKPSISVVKNIGGTDTSRFGAAPNLLAHGAHNSHHHSHHQTHPAHLQHAHHSHHHTAQSHHLSRQEAAALAAGKGTRPKRGKYRNYDRDSLVEAVKAVQRGEMSVHRAGSYYGVPHSTLEYKVKERHLMRPRKREPKPQPGLDGSSTTGGSGAAAKSNSNIPGLNSLDKMKGGGGAAASAKLKNNNSSNNNNNNNGSAVNFSNAAPANGMKLQMFDPAFAAHLQYHQPQLFWQHAPTTPFSQMQMDFSRSAATQAANASGSGADGGGGNVNVDILKTHIQRCQEEAALRAASASEAANSPSPLASAQVAAAAALSMKSAHEFPDNLYEGGGAGANGSSFFEGIIRKTLNCDVAPPSGGGALLDQLLVKKSKLPYANNRSSDYASAPTKRAASPLPLAEIKRERTSPVHSSDDDDASQSCADDQLERNNNNKSNLSGNGGLSQRSRMTSRDCDSETDASSIKSELPHPHAHQNHNHNHSGGGGHIMADLNGGARVEAAALRLGGTSILQEKLAQIKSEQESEERL